MLEVTKMRLTSINVSESRGLRCIGWARKTDKDSEGTISLSQGSTGNRDRR